MAVSFALEKGLGTIMGTLRSFLLVSVWAITLSGSGTAQVRTNAERAVSAGIAAYDRADYAEAVRWFRLGAGQGNALAQYSLGVMHDNGEGVPENDAEAVRWYRLAADQGNADAQLNLGTMYDNGEGVPENDAEAVRWYRLAADQGDATAQFNLGTMYDEGNGVPENDVQAVRWYRLAADQGDADAQYNLGVMYAEGEGMPENYVQAYKWSSLAAAQGGIDAAKNRDIIRSQMTPAQIAEGQRLAAEWKPRTSESATAPNAALEKSSVAGDIQGTGSGFFVTAAGHVLTNAHVVEDCSRASLADGARLTILDVDTGSDLALLKTDATSTRAPLSLRQGRGVRLADSVMVAGYPLTGLLSSGLNVTTGSVSALAGPEDDRRLIQITAPVQPGNSGGPLLDTSGNVVGVVVSKLNAVKVASLTGDIPQNVNFAISLGTLQAFLDANNVDYQTRASASPKSNADVAEMARAATVQIECRN
jgi:TPR repeat protein